MMTMIPFEKTTLKILTSEGKIVFSKQLYLDKGGFREVLNISDLTAGFYVVKVYNDQTNLVQKLTIE